VSAEVSPMELKASRQVTVYDASADLKMGLEANPRGSVPSLPAHEVDATSLCRKPPKRALALHEIRARSREGEAVDRCPLIHFTAVRCKQKSSQKSSLASPARERPKLFRSSCSNERRDRAIH
jgi:hypothetical protein